MLGGSTAPLQAATITGTITWSNTATAARETVLRDRHVCPPEVPVKQVEVGPGGSVAQAVVWVDAPAVKKPPRRDATLDQKGCLFVPVAQAATVGSSLLVRSSDPVLHNVHIKDESGATVANFSMPVMGQQAKLSLKKAGTFSVRCEAGHEWMRAALVVLDHARFSVTGPDGRFELHDVAPGPHRVIAFHPELGRIERTVVVSEGSTPVRVDLAF